ncbi:Protein ROS1 [Capsicum chinense]|nr:Protein ROS1 [Capsicum chinense]
MAEEELDEEEVLTQEPLQQSKPIAVRRHRQEIQKPACFTDMVAYALSVTDEDVPSTYPPRGHSKHRKWQLGRARIQGKSPVRAVSVVSRYMHDLGKGHWQAVKWILRYLQNTVDVGLTFERDKSLGQCIVGYCDSDYACNRQFSKWKGSIVDSVAGVFLAQNVADNLSSSAFMSLAAQYPSNEVRFKSTFHNGNEKTSLEKSSKGHSNNKNRGINRRTNRNGGKKKKEETRYQQAEPILTRKSKNADLKSEAITWENIRTLSSFINPKERSDSTLDAIDWHAVHAATAEKISEAIMQRGMDKKLARRIKNFIHRLILEQGNVDLEWLREVQPEKAKEYLLSIYGLGVKSVECIRLLTLRHQAFPVDTNVGRVLVRLGWVPIQPLPRGKKMNLLKMYPDVKDVHKYLWPRLCTLDHLALYEFHHQMITFGKVFCTKSSPNCNACPMKAECRHFASAFTSERVLLTGPGEKSSKNIDTSLAPLDSTRHADSSQANIVSYVGEASNSQHSIGDHQNEVITYPALECIGETNIEDYGASDIPTITFDPKAFMENLLSYIDESDLSINDTDLSKARVIATQEVPLPKLKHRGRLRTEHQVYELPDSHPLLEGLEKREPEDACPYLLALRTPGNAASEEPTKEKRESCNCDGTQNEVDASNIQTVSGTLLIPCRTANKGKFPLNGTYFQVNEVFADEESTQQPIEVPRVWLWNLPRRTLYCGTSIRAIFKGMSTKEVQHCFWRGYVCLRGFNRKTRIPGPLPYDLHRPISKSGKAKSSRRQAHVASNFSSDGKSASSTDHRCVLRKKKEKGGSVEECAGQVDPTISGGHAWASKRKGSCSKLCDFQTGAYPVKL